MKKCKTSIRGILTTTSMGRIVLYELTRHSDHHFRASKKYQVLESLENSPTMPFGYPGSMLLATLPPTVVHGHASEVTKLSI